MIESFLNAIKTQNKSDLKHLLDAKIALKIPTQFSLFNFDEILDTLLNYHDVHITHHEQYLSFYIVYFEYKNRQYIGKIKAENDKIRSIYIEPINHDIRRIRLDIQYDGSFYHGSQRQPNVYTVQEALEKCLSNLLVETIQIQSASRTDKGVHAYHQAIHFDTNNPLPLDKIKSLLNQMLDPSIFILNATLVPQVFHTRYDVIKKTYVYKISHIKNPFKANYAYYHKVIDLSILSENMNVFLGKHDFRSFSKSSDTEDTVRTIYAINVYSVGSETHIEITGDGFLRNMIRMMIGQVLYDIDFKKETVKNFLENPSDQAMKNLAPSEGLYLKSITYK